MENGFIYPLIKVFVDGLNKVSLVEYFKKISQLFNRHKTEVSVRTYDNIAIDIFRIFKWSIVALLWFLGVSIFISQVLVWYFLAANLYSYFYYHAWYDQALEARMPGQNNYHRVRKRLVNLFLAVLYSDFCFAYLYRIPYMTDFNWGKAPDSGHAFWFSFSNSIAANYNVVTPITNLGNTVAMIQLLMTFVFISIILSRTNSQAAN